MLLELHYGLGAGRRFGSEPDEFECQRGAIADVELDGRRRAQNHVVYLRQDSNPRFTEPVKRTRSAS